MTSQQGETAVTTSALVCTGLWGYRKATETITKAPKSAGVPGGVKGYAEGVLGVGELLGTGPWLTGMGLTFITLSVLTSVNPTFGGSLAILVLTGAVLGNGQAVIKDLQGGLSSTKTAASTAAPAPLGSSPLNTPPTK